MTFHNLKQSIASFKIVLLGIIVLAALLRFINLSNNPNGFFCDEASVGYDGYCLLQTGCDQYGTFMPLFARSFGDYNEALSRYLTVPVIAILGLNEFSTRFPSALIGTITVLIIFYLCNKIYDKKFALLSAVLLAVSPWHILFSRIAFRAILLPFFVGLALLLFLKGLENWKYLYISFILWGVSLYTYSVARIFVPLLILSSILCYLRKIQSKIKHILYAGLLGVIISLPAVIFWLSPEGMARANATVFWKELNTLSLLSIFKNFGINYWSYFSPAFLFVRGDPNIRHGITLMGQLYPFEILTVPIGLIFLIKHFQKTKILILWLVFYPITAALTEPSHALRGILGSVIFPIISAAGIYMCVGYIRRFHIKMRTITIVLVIILVSINIYTFLKIYFIEYPKYSIQWWQYGYRELIRHAENDLYSEIYISDQFFLPHIFILFYTKYPPKEYQKSPLLSLKQNQWYYSNFDIGKYHVVDIDQLHEIQKRGLFIVFTNEVKKVHLLYDTRFTINETKVIRDENDLPMITLLEYSEL